MRHAWMPSWPPVCVSAAGRRQSPLSPDRAEGQRGGAKGSKRSEGRLLKPNATRTHRNSFLACCQPAELPTSLRAFIDPHRLRHTIAPLRYQPVARREGPTTDFAYSLMRALAPFALQRAPFRHASKRCKFQRGRCPFLSILVQVLMLHSFSEIEIQKMQPDVLWLRGNQ
jgi:hypothetical protein